MKLDGEVGVLGNGAGLTMSTVDVVTFVGGRPANFCDLGGGGDAQGVVDALEVITRDAQVRSIFFNIFGGITRCDEVARGILQAVEQMGLELPDRRAPRRDERRGGPAHPRRGGASEPPCGGDDARRRAACGGARGLMAILVDTETRLVVQGLTGSEGRFHGLRNRSHGTNVVAGVTPGKGGQDVEGIPVFDTVAAAVAETGANTAMVFVPAPFAADAMYEAIDAGIETVICITEGVPAHEMLRLHAFIQGRDVRSIGPNCPGALSPGKANVGIIPAEIFREGSIGLVSRSGTLTYQIGHELTQLGLGYSTIVGIGGDPIVGSSFIDVLALFEADPQTEQVVMVGEIGGDEEEKAAAFIEAEMSKPVVGVHRGLHGAARARRWGTPARSSPAPPGRRRRRRTRSRRAASGSGRRRPRPPARRRDRRPRSASRDQPDRLVRSARSRDERRYADAGSGDPGGLGMRVGRARRYSPREPEP